jgi:hypothetical protein
MDHGWLPPRHVDKRVHMQGWWWRWCWPKLRRWSDQVKAGEQALGDRSVEDERDTRRHHGKDVVATRLQVGLAVWAPNCGRQVCWDLGLKPWGRISGSTWWHLRVSVEAKQRGEAIMAVRCVSGVFLCNMDHIAPKWVGSLSISLG